MRDSDKARRKTEISRFCNGNQGPKLHTGDKLIQICKAPAIPDLRHFARFINPGPDKFLRPFNPCQIKLPRIRDKNAICSPGKELYIQRLLQLGNRLRDRRLRKEHLLRCAADALMRRDDTKGAQMPQIGSHIDHKNTLLLAENFLDYRKKLYHKCQFEIAKSAVTEHGKIGN